MKILTINRYATHEYEIFDKYIAGIVLDGGEIKSARANNINIKDAFGIFQGKELFLLNCFIGQYKNSFNHDAKNERRTRKLLLTKKELKCIFGDISQKGLTIVPLKAFLGDKGFLKIEIGIAKHKKLFDKRRDIKERALSREANRALKNIGK